MLPGKFAGPGAPISGDNVGMPYLDPSSVIEAVARDPQLRAFVGHGRIETIPARQSRRRLLLDNIAQLFQLSVTPQQFATNMNQVIGQ